MALGETAPIVASNTATLSIRRTGDLRRIN
jgi:hypothetical protein